MTVRNKTVVVTGGTSGIGRATAIQLASIGADVLVTGRDVARGSAIEKALRAAGSRSARFLRADHSTLEGNLTLAEQVTQAVERVDVLVNNVGGLFSTRETTEDGAELTLALNVRSPVVLTDRLRPVLAPGGLVLNVASDAFTRCTGDAFEVIGEGGAYEPFEAYARAKTLLVLATLAHARQLRPDRVSVVAVNPGPAWTPGTQGLTPDCVPVPTLMWPVVRLVQRSRSADRAAHVVSRLAVAGDVPSGSYVTPRGKIRDLGALRDDIERQDRAVQLAWSLGNTSDRLGATDA